MFRNEPEGFERVDTNNGILAVGNWLQRPTRQPPSLKGSGTVSGYSVYLPNAMDSVDVGYAEYLLKNPHPKVKLNFTSGDLGV